VVILLELFLVYVSYLYILNHVHHLHLLTVRSKQKHKTKHINKKNHIQQMSTNITHKKFKHNPNKREHVLL